MNPDDLYLYRAKGVEHPTLFVHMPPSTDDEGNWVTPEGMYMYDEFMIGRVGWAISFCNCTDFQMQLTMAAPASHGTPAANMMLGTAQRLGALATEYEKNYAILFHPSLTIIDGYIIEMHETLEECGAAYENLVERMKMGDLRVRYLGQTEDVFGEPMWRENRFLRVQMPRSLIGEDPNQNPN